jgi:hypothetical protein
VLEFSARPQVHDAVIEISPERAKILLALKDALLRGDEDGARELSLAN